MTKKKQIIGVIEKIIIAGSNGKKKEVFARIDTGADYSSIDKTIARKIGYSETINEFHDKLIKCGKKIFEMKRVDKEEYFSGIPFFKTCFKIKSVHGFSYRPVVNILVNIKGMEIKTKATIIDRSQLKYPVIIGRKDLSGFLVNIISEKM